MADLYPEKPSCSSLSSYTHNTQQSHPPGLSPTSQLFPPQAKAYLCFPSILWISDLTHLPYSPTSALQDYHLIARNLLESPIEYPARTCLMTSSCHHLGPFLCPECTWCAKDKEAPSCPWPMGLTLTLWSPSPSSAPCNPPPSTSPATGHLSTRGILKPTDLPFPESTLGSQDSTPCLGSVRWDPPLPVCLSLASLAKVPVLTPPITLPHSRLTASFRGSADGTLQPSGSAWGVSSAFNPSSAFPEACGEPFPPHLWWLPSGDLS